MVKVQEGIDQFWVEKDARVLSDVFQYRFFGAATPVRSVRQERIPNINDGEDARGERDFIPFEAARVTGAVPAFVVTVGNIQRGAQVGDGIEHLPGIFGMFAHFFPLFVGQRSRFLQYAVRNAHFADVMQQRTPSQVDDIVFVDAQGARQAHCNFGHALGVAFGFLVAQVEDARPAFNGFIVGFGQVFVGALEFDFGALTLGDVADDGNDTGFVVNFNDAGGNETNPDFSLFVFEDAFHVWPGRAAAWRA